jgi:hypothetical protein
MTRQIAELPLSKLTVAEPFDIILPVGTTVLAVKARPPRPSSLLIAGFDSSVCVIFIVEAPTDPATKAESRRFIAVPTGKVYRPTPGSKYLDTLMTYTGREELTTIHFFEIPPITVSNRAPLEVVN